MKAQETVLVYGATGPQGRPVAEGLVQAGFRVKALVRDLGRGAELERLGVQLVVGDLSDPESLRRAHQGVQAVSLFVPFFAPRIEYGHHAIEAALQAGVERVVWNPTGTIPPARTGAPGLDVRLEVMALLEASGLDYVVVQPTAYMENFLMPGLVEELKTKRTFSYPMPPTSRMQWISHHDVAQFVVRAFQSPGLHRRVFEVSGPEALTGPEIAERLSRALERTILFRPMPPVEFGQVLDRAFGSGAGAAVVGFYEAIFADPTRFGSSVDLAKALAELPIEPTTIEAWARQRRALLA